EDTFVFVRAHHLRFGDIHAAAHRNQQERVQSIRAEIANKFKYFRKLDRVMLRDRHVDLNWHTQFFQIPEAVNRRVIGAWDAAERIMCFSIRAVERDADALYAGVDDLFRDLFGYKGPVCRQGNAKVALGSVSSELEN